MRRVKTLLEEPGKGSPMKPDEGQYYSLFLDGESYCPDANFYERVVGDRWTLLSQGSLAPVNAVLVDTQRGGQKTSNNSMGAT
ncbi:jg14849 [Pararge aegeria aegeria]|uniref:Jg14849 protein n=1 Tax=Pararge aegeria aegeria TaxID=348720 RepID=A0A8S4R101_9NEOP|nr:jg14849 [Pararge aegeria aegeria]